jgi:PRTRC genetic system protein B
MNVSVSLGTNHDFTLQDALLIYRDHGKVFVTRHEVRKSPSLSLGPAETLTGEFLKSLMRSFGIKTTLDVLPERIIAHNDETTVWWMPAQRRQMFFNDSEKKMTPISGRVFPHPALLFVAQARALWVRALAEDKRPTANSILSVAPYWNTSENGSVCLGNMQEPDTVGVHAIEQWERGFFESAFSHANGAERLTLHKGGFAALWRDLADSMDEFPVNQLVSTQQTLANYLATDF